MLEHHKRTGEKGKGIGGFTYRKEVTTVYTNSEQG